MTTTIQPALAIDAPLTDAVRGQHVSSFHLPELCCPMCCGAQVYRSTFFISVAGVPAHYETRDECISCGRNLAAGINSEWIVRDVGTSCPISVTPGVCESCESSNVRIEEHLAAAIPARFRVCFDCGWETPL